MGIFPQAGNTYDLIGICVGTVDFILLAIYVGFAYLATHRGDFYEVRRWKAAIWAACIFGAVVLAVFLGAVMLAFILNVSTLSLIAGGLRKDSVAVGSMMLIVALPAVCLITLSMFLVTWGVHRRLKWWLDSDDFLDKIWKDPNKGHRSPIQEI